MTDFTLGLLAFPVLMGLIFLRVPIGFAMLSVGLVGSYLINGSFVPVLAQLKHLTYTTFSNYSFSIIPLFLMMGQFATLGGLSERLFAAARAWLGHRPGGIGMATIGASAGFGAICGSSLATVSTMGQVALPELRRAGYSGGFSTGLLAASGTLGILIPPSVILVIYAILAEQNIAKLFAAALVPGILAAGSYMFTTYLIARFLSAAGKPLERIPYRERFVLLGRTWPVVVIFGLVIGGIYGGIFTPTEAAAIGAAGTGLIAFFYRGLNRDTLKEAIFSTMSATAMIFVIIFGAAVFNTFIALTRMPHELTELIGQLDMAPFAILAAVLLIYLIFGCVMDSLSMIVLTIPIFFPILSALDFGLTPEEFAIWFGIIVLVVVEVGLITPPVGMNLFLVNSLAKDVRISETYRFVTPYVLTDLVRIALLVGFPIISLFVLQFW